MKKTKKELLLIIIIFLSIGWNREVNTADIKGVFFKDAYSVSSEILHLRGYAILNYMLVIKAYAGALYLKKDTPSGMALSKTPRILELYYFHKISAEDFRVSTIKMIKKNTTGEQFKRIENQIYTFNRFYRNVRPGDRYKAEYSPDTGTKLYLNGKLLGTVKGTEFSKAFFSIWIGKNPIDKKFRNILLGRK